jgi:hypothetical protein
MQVVLRFGSRSARSSTGIRRIARLGGRALAWLLIAATVLLLLATAVEATSSLGSPAPSLVVPAPQPAPVGP